MCCRAFVSHKNRGERWKLCLQLGASCGEGRTAETHHALALIDAKHTLLFFVKGGRKKIDPLNLPSNSLQIVSASVYKINSRPRFPSVMKLWIKCVFILKLYFVGSLETADSHNLLKTFFFYQCLLFIFKNGKIDELLVPVAPQSSLLAFDFYELTKIVADSFVLCDQNHNEIR